MPDAADAAGRTDLVRACEAGAGEFAGRRLQGHVQFVGRLLRLRAWMRLQGEIGIIAEIEGVVDLRLIRARLLEELGAP